MVNQERKKMIQQAFDTVAQGYDNPSLAFFPQTAKSMMEYLKLDGRQQLLDVCTGTGMVALAAAQLLTEGKVTGIDFSSGMLQQAKNKATDMSLNNTEFLQMDLDELDFSSETFDIACSSFGLFFMDDMTKALKNIIRVVKPGGKIAISSFTGDAFSPMSDLFLQCYESFGKEVPPLSWKRLATKELIGEQFAAAGLDKVEVYHEPLGYHMSNAQMWWDVVWNAGYRGLLNQLTDEQLTEFKDRHMAEITQLVGDDGIWFNTEVLIGIAKK